jgi:N-acetylglucosaminyldiphosphoundecaprenol N-acetyl-beta-D-mannosaminyltransferase
MNRLPTRRIGVVLNTALDVTSHEITCARVFELAQQERPAYICFATAHMVIEANRRPDVSQAYRDSAIVNPDGRPLAWALRLLGHQNAHCVSGPNQTPFLLREAERRGTPVGFYGGRPETIARMKEALSEMYPNLKVDYLYSPPFRELNEAEQAEVAAAINASGVRLLFIGLGSIKQEVWMWRNCASLQCVCLGVGAVFEFVSREKLLPPLWVQTLGLTWLIRLCQEPRRLFRRNLYSPVFVVMFCLQLLTELCWRLMGISRTKKALVGRDTP